MTFLKQKMVKSKIIVPWRTSGSVCILTVALSACNDLASDDLNSGGLEPPPGFLQRVDQNCRADAEIDLTDQAATVRQLNGQSLLTYTLADGTKVQCAIRHADESVIDIRVINAESAPL